ncbi:acetyl-CoA carboxylase biotin carboxylase subunit [Holzapfeliella sp. He02]|uniref:Biotin carboxylase n=1 Tax=Holzapfeliella saturejae TaxID=3082953 RepID=A0ABU8SI64_9LACO
MFSKVLVANRGEIALQIIRSLQEMNIKAVAIYSTADKNELFVKQADEAVCIGEGPANKSYLDMSEVISAAVLTGCEALHPGYGFLSENAEFAELCESCGITYIGPKYQTINLMGNKSNARLTMKNSGVPVIPGSDGLVDTAEDAVKIAEQIGYPVMLKAADGGGGKGMRQANNKEEVLTLFEQTQQEAKLSFNNGSLYLEKIIEKAKHIEVQVMSDQFGNTVYFPERDCSLQFHHQKVLEETPCRLINDNQRQQLGEIVVKACQEIGYLNTGTFEFLMDEDQNFYFMEMNTRLQVEHTVTEEVSGVEMIKTQIKVAAGEALPFKQEDVKATGHALECRINAQNPAQNFTPSPGQIKKLNLPMGTLGVRIDTGITADSFISPYYDSMIAKLIVHMDTREQTINKMKRLLGEFEIEGVKSNHLFLRDLLSDETVENETFNNDYIEHSFFKRWVSDDTK